MRNGGDGVDRNVGEEAPGQVNTSSERIEVDGDVPEWAAEYRFHEGAAVVAEHQAAAVMLAE